MGFETLLPDRLQAPIIVTVRMPADPKFHFESFYDRLAQRGYVIYPGKLTVADSFRVGCIGGSARPRYAGRSTPSETWSPSSGSPPARQEHGEAQPKARPSEYKKEASG